MNKALRAAVLVTAVSASAAANASTLMIPGCIDGSVTDYGGAYFHGICPDLPKAAAFLWEKYHTNVIATPSGVSTQDGLGYWLDARYPGDCSVK